MITLTLSPLPTISILLPMSIISGSKIITKRSVKHCMAGLFAHQGHVHKLVPFSLSGIFEAFHFSILIAPTLPSPP